MLRFYTALTKEFLILVRDIPGLAILFIMPVLLILIVTLAQQNALKSSRESKTELLLVDQANTPFSSLLKQNLDSSGLYRLIGLTGRIRLTKEEAEKRVGSGDYPVAIVIGPRDSTIQLLVDPGLQSAYKNSLVGSLTYFIKGTQTRMMMETLLKSMSPAMAQGLNAFMESALKKLPPVKETYATGESTQLKPSITQNSVPGFILFAMFFIVIPLSASMISEKNEGSFSRLRTLPVKVTVLLSSKVVLYLAVCLVQFALMLLAGTWILPSFFGMPALQMGSAYGAILLATLAAGLAAIGFGLLVGTTATSTGQAALFGSVTVVILGVISGTFLPVHLMPKPIQTLSMISPIRWGIDSYLVLFVRGGTIGGILPDILKLLSFFVFAMIISIAIFAKRK